MVMIDTTTTNNPSTNNVQSNLTLYAQEEQKHDSILGHCLKALTNLQTKELHNNPGQHRNTVETLLKIVKNLLA